MPRYFNDDKMPKRPKRIMKKLSREDFWDLMFKTASKYDSYGEISYPYDIDEDDGGYTILSILLSQCESVRLDLRMIDVDGENLTCSYDDVFGDTVVGKPMLGLQTINDEFTFFGFQMGGDWEYPVFAIIYYNGQDFHIYFPSCGNTVNLDFKCAFGSEYLDANNVYKVQKITDMYSKVVSAHPNRGTFDASMFEDTDRLSEIYGMKYDMDLNPSNYGFNWDLIRQDILNMFVVR